MSKHTTVRLKEALLKRAKAYAAKNDLTLTAVMERALAAYLADPTLRGAADQPVKLPVFGRGGVQPNVDLDDTAKLNDLMDGIE
jgi:hypothetical protein